MPKIDRHIREIVVLGLALAARFPHEGVDDVFEVVFVLSLGGEGLAGHFDEVLLGVVAHAEEFDEFEALGRGEGEVGGAEFEADFVGGRVGFAHVAGVAEAEGRG